MVQINFAQKTVNVKIVYYGPGMSGKTTNLEVVHQRSPDTNHGELTSISTDGDRTLFFDYMPLELGTVAGMRTCFQLYTVPGQVYYNSTRKLVLQGVDGVIFVADSSRGMLEQNLESLRNLEENLNEYGKSLSTMAHVIQWNKRDLPDAMPVDELEKHLNHHGAPAFEGVANTGQGVFPTLKALAAAVLKDIMKESAGGGQSAPAAAPAPCRSAPAAQPQSAGAFGNPVTPPAAPTPAAPTPAAARPAPAAAAASSGGHELGRPEPEVPAAVPSPPPDVHAQPASRTLQVAAPEAAPAGHTADLMQVQRPSHAQPKPRAQASHGAAVRRARASHAAPAPKAKARAKAKAKAKKKGGALPTGVFVALAAGVGAAIAWAALSVLV